MRTHAQRAADEHGAAADPADAHHAHADDHDADDALGRHGSGTARRRRRAGGHGRRRRARPAAATSTPPATPIAGDQIYCTTAQKFTTYEKTPPAISLLTKTLKGGTRAGVQLSLSKISTVRLTVRQGGRTCLDEQRLPRRAASPKLLWVTPTRRRHVQRHAERDRPGGQLRDGDRHDRRLPRLTRRARILAPGRA